MFLYGLGGLAFLINPAALPPLEKIGLNAAGALIARSHGADLIGWAVAFFLARNEQPSGALRALVIGSACYLAIETPLLASAAWSGVMSGWGGPATDALLLIGFGYFALKLKAEGPHAIPGSPA